MTQSPLEQYLLEKIETEFSFPFKSQKIKIAKEIIPLAVKWTNSLPKSLRRGFVLGSEKYFGDECEKYITANLQPKTGVDDVVHTFSVLWYIIKNINFFGPLLLKFVISAISSLTIQFLKSV